MVYIKEAHPSDGWVSQGNVRQGIDIKDPTTLEERMGIAQKACSVLKLNLPCLVDSMEDVANKAYSAWPDRIYVIDLEGKIAVKGGPGPGGFKPSVETTRRWLEQKFSAIQPTEDFERKHLVTYTQSQIDFQYQPELRPFSD